MFQIAHGHQFISTAYSPELVGKNVGEIRGLVSELLGIPKGKAPKAMRRGLEDLNGLPVDVPENYVPVDGDRIEFELLDYRTEEEKPWHEQIYACAVCNAQDKKGNGRSCYGGCGRIFCGRCCKDGLLMSLCRDCHKLIPEYMTENKVHLEEICNAITGGRFEDGAKVLATLKERRIVLVRETQGENDYEYAANAFDTVVKLKKCVHDAVSKGSDVLAIWIDGREFEAEIVVNLHPKIQ